MSPHSRASSKRYHLHLRVPHYGFSSSRASPIDYIADPRGEPHFPHDLGHHVSRERGHLARLADDRTAGSKGWGNLKGEQVKREVPRGNKPCHAHRGTGCVVGDPKFRLVGRPVFVSGVWSGVAGRGRGWKGGRSHHGMLSLDTRRGCYTNSGLTHARVYVKTTTAQCLALKLQMELTRELTHPKCAGWPRQKI